jgi:hypothetical protein
MATVVTVYFATNRQPLTNGGDRIIYFGPELGPISGLNRQVPLAKGFILRRISCRFSADCCGVW